MPSPVPGATSYAGAIMTKLPLPIPFDEPVGIVISRGREPETTPRFSAYVWAPFPGDVIEDEEKEEQAA